MTERRVYGRQAAPHSPDAMSADARSTSGLWDHLRTFVRHRWWAALGFALTAVPMGAVTLLTTPVFMATTRVLVSEEAGQSLGLGTQDKRRPPDGTNDPRTQSEVVRSRALARDVIERVKLWEAPEYSGAVANLKDDAAKARALVDAFLGRLSVEAVRDTRLMAISFEAQDPDLAAKAVNAVATRYIERDQESRFVAANSSTEWLEKQLAVARDQVSARETALQLYRARRDAMSLQDRQNIVGQKLNDLNTAVTKAKTERISRETKYKQIEALKTDFAALEAHSSVASNTFVQSLKAQEAELSRQDAQLAERFGPKHPDRLQVSSALASVRSRLQAEIGKVVEGIEADYQAAVSDETGLTEALGAQKREALSLDVKGVEYAALEREAASARQVFDSLLQQTKEATLSGDLQKSPFRLIDAAEPPGFPVRPRRTQGLAAAAVLGLLGAFSGAFGREYARRRVASTNDVEALLGLPVLALIPPMDDAEAQRIGGLAPVPMEAIRKLRAAVMMACGGGEHPGNLLVVTSAAPGDGKSFVAAHLAAALASVDQRVVLIDADMRRPRLHTMFDRQRAPGLSDALLGRRSPAEILRPVGQQGLALVPGGIPSSQAGELLALPAFRKFLTDLRADFDWIVIDSPPVMAVADATVLAHAATGVLFVTSADATSIEGAAAALETLDAAGAHLIGAVLNRAPLTREAFYYSRYYRPEYANYLSDVPDSATAPADANASAQAS